MQNICQQMVNESQGVQPLTRLIKLSQFSKHKKHQIFQKLNKFNIASVCQLIVQVSYLLKKFYNDNILLLLSKNIFSDEYQNVYVIYEEAQLCKKQIQDKKQEYFILNKQIFILLGNTHIRKDFSKIVNLYYKTFYFHLSNFPQSHFILEDISRWGSHFLDYIQSEKEDQQQVWNFLQGLDIFLSFSDYVKFKNTLIGVRLVKNETNFKPMIKNISQLFDCVPQLNNQDIRNELTFTKLFLQQCFRLLDSENLLGIQQDTVLCSQFMLKKQQLTQLPRKILAFNVSINQTKGIYNRSKHLAKQQLEKIDTLTANSTAENKNFIFSHFNENFDSEIAEQLKFKLICLSEVQDQWNFNLQLYFPLKVCALYYFQFKAEIDKIRCISQLQHFSTYLNKSSKIVIIQSFSIKISWALEYKLQFLQKIIRLVDKMIVWYLALKPIFSVIVKRANFQGPSCLCPLIQQEEKSLFNSAQHLNIVKKVKKFFNLYDEMTTKDLFPKKSFNFVSNLN